MEMKLNNYFRLKRSLDSAIKNSEYCKANPDKRKIVQIDSDDFFKNLNRAWREKSKPKVKFTGTKKERRIKREKYKLLNPKEKIVTYYEFI